MIRVILLYTIIYLHVFSYFGKNEVIIRTPSAIFGIGTILVTYLLAKNLYDNKTGLIAACLASFSPLLIYFSQMARMYSQFVFLSIISIFFVVLIIKKKRLIFYLAYILSTTLCLYTHFFSLYLLMAENIFMFLSWKRKKESLKLWIISQSFILILFLPGIYLIIIMMGEHPTVQPSIIKIILSTFTQFTFGKTVLPINFNLFVLVSGSILFLYCLKNSIFELFKEKDINLILFVSFFIAYTTILAVKL